MQQKKKNGKKFVNIQENISFNIFINIHVTLKI